MFRLIRNIQNIFKMTKLSRLVELAKQADEVLLGSNLNSQTRQALQQKSRRSGGADPGIAGGVSCLHRWNIKRTNPCNCY